EACLDLLARRQHQWLLVRDDHRDQGTCRLVGIEPAGDRLMPKLRVAGAERHHRKRVPAHNRPRYTAAAIDPRRAARIAEPRLDAPAHWHSSGDPLDPADELTKRPERSRRERQ